MRQATGHTRECSRVHPKLARVRHQASGVERDEQIFRECRFTTEKTRMRKPRETSALARGGPPGHQDVFIARRHVPTLRHTRELDDRPRRRARSVLGQARRAPRVWIGRRTNLPAGGEGSRTRRGAFGRPRRQRAGRVSERRGGHRDVLLERVRVARGVRRAELARERGRGPKRGEVAARPSARASVARRAPGGPDAARANENQERVRGPRAARSRSRRGRCSG